MRWDALFADLEGRALAEAEAERRWEIADRSMAERGRLRLVDRIRPLLDQPGSQLQLAVIGHEPIAGSVTAVGVDWLLLERAVGEEWLVALQAVSWIRGLGPQAAEPGWEGFVGARLGLKPMIRQLLRERSPVTVYLVGGGVLAGQLSRVGADHIELDEPSAGRREVRRSWALPLAALAAMHRQSFGGAAH